jgi:FerB (NUC096) domain
MSIYVSTCVRFPTIFSDDNLLTQQEQIGLIARNIRSYVNASNVKDKLKQSAGLLGRLQRLCVEPQHAMPDVFIWILQNNRRIAYHRVPAKDIIYSMINEEKGGSCAKIQTLFLKVNHFNVCISICSDIILDFSSQTVQMLSLSMLYAQ